MITLYDIHKIIALACGWTQSSWSETLLEDPSYNIAQFPPAYTSSLDLIHEAEKSLNELERLKYYNRLRLVIFKSNKRDEVVSSEKELADSYYNLLHATAKQKTEAFLKAKNQWKEEFRSVIYEGKSN